MSANAPDLPGKMTGTKRFRFACRAEPRQSPLWAGIQPSGER
jgi:hypothetical protein